MEDRERDKIVFGYESALNKFHHIIKWLIIVIVVLIISLVGTNLAWVIYENQFETVSVDEENEVNAVQLGESNFVSGGDLTYGTDSSNKD